MKKFTIVVLGILGATAIIIALYIFTSGMISGGKHANQAAAILAVEQNSHLSKDAFLDRTKLPDMTIIDVRTPQEYESEHIDGAINIDFYAADFTQQLERLDKSLAYSIYCRSGSRSGKALSIMRDLGFIDVADLEGGYASLSR